MTEILVQITFGWPAVITSILLSIIGMRLKKPALLVIAGIICIPFTYYIGNGFRSPAAFLPVFQFASAYTLTRGRELIAWSLITPLIVVSVALAMPFGRNSFITKILVAAPTKLTGSWI